MDLKKRFDTRDSMRPDPQILAATYRLSLAPKKRNFSLVKRPRKKASQSTPSSSSQPADKAETAIIHKKTHAANKTTDDGKNKINSINNNSNSNNSNNNNNNAMYIGTSTWRIDEVAEDEENSNDEDYDDDLRPESVKSEPHVDQAKHTYVTMCKALDVQPFKAFHNALTLDHVNMSHMTLTPDDLKACAIALVHTDNVEKVTFDGNNMGSLGTARIAEILPQKFEFRELIIRNNKVGSEGARLLCQVLLNNNNIRKLDLSGNDFSEEDGAMFAELLEENPALREVNLSHNNFRCKGGQLIAEGLAKNRFLKKLDLSWNHLRMEGAVAMGEALQENSDLEELNLAWNGFHLRGCMALGHALKHNSSLLSLDLTCNRISELCLAQLMKGIKENTSLTTIKLPLNPLSPQAAYSILQFIDANKDIALQHVDLGDQCVYDEFKMFLEEIQKGRDLEVLYGPILRTGLVIENGTVEEEEANPMDENPLIVLMEYCRLQNLRLVDMFNHIDTDNSRSLTYDEFVEGLKKVNIPLQESSLRNLLLMLDRDKDGSIDFSELIEGQKEYKRLVQEALREGDLDNSVVGQIGMRMKQHIKDKYLLRKF